MYGISFKNAEHEKAFYLFLKRFDVDSKDLERVSLFYLLALSSDCRNNVEDLYDRENKCVKPDGLHHGWVTSGDARIIRLAFNLFNGGVPTSTIKSEEKYNNLYNYSKEFAYNYNELYYSLPANLFYDSENGKYFIDALKLRFPALQDED